MHLQAAQLLGTRLRQPGQDGATTRIGLHKLLGGPQSFGWRVGGNPDQVLFCNPEFDQARGMGAFGRAYQQDLAAGSSEQRQCGRKKTPFAQGGLRLQQLRQRIAWPPAAGQLSVEGFESSGHDSLASLTDICSPPNGLRDIGRELRNVERLRRLSTGGGCGVHYPLDCGGHWGSGDYCIKVQYIQIRQMVKDFWPLRESYGWTCRHTTFGRANLTGLMNMFWWHRVAEAGQYVVNATVEHSTGRC